MKKLTILAITAFLAATASPQSFSLSPLETNDALASTLKVKALQTKREAILKRIKAEDAKRNQQIAGVSPERLEEINDRQDSVCLALRSELTEIVLELKELSPNINSQTIAVPVSQILNSQTLEIADSVLNLQSKP